MVVSFIGNHISGIFSVSSNVNAVEPSVEVRLFAGGCAAYEKIKRVRDHTVHQQSLISVVHKCNVWKTKLNYDKSVFIRLTNKLNVSDYTYLIDGCPSLRVIEYQYLGVDLTSNLSWLKHIKIFARPAFANLANCVVG